MGPNPDPRYKYPWAFGKLKPDANKALLVEAKGKAGRQRVSNAARMWCRRNYPDYQIVAHRYGDHLKIWMVKRKRR